MLITLGGNRLPLLGRARVYVCGITPYDTTHVGHAATFIWSDVAVRLFRRMGLDVQVARNITDVDDQLVAHARGQRTSWRSIAVQQTYRFEDDVARLGILTPTFEPLAHNHIDDVIDLSQALIDLDRAYVREGSVYFRAVGVAEAAGLGRDEALVLAAERGGRIDDPAKDDPLDAALWQRSGTDDPAWESPWGPGRPGWHAECAAMALATLGPGIDLHCGGADLAFPHHAFEAAHAEAAVGVVPFSRAWLRAGTVSSGGAKMAKSTGNLVFVNDILQRWTPAALRLTVVSRRWWEDWSFDESALADAERRVSMLRSAAARPGGHREHDQVLAALSDDLDVPTALAIAEAAGGASAELLVDVLGLRHREHVQRSSIVPYS